jgi:DNA-binding CsgD family transcriptional regulator
MTAAFTGLRRGELLALRWRDVDFEASAIRVRASHSGGARTMPKSGRVRSVPMAPDVGQVLARLGQRPRFTSDDDLVFAGELGGYLDGSALRRRYDRALRRAGLRPLRFHDLRHTFGTRMMGRADIRRVQEWMGHADIQTTMKYLHYVPRHDDAALVEPHDSVVDSGHGRTRQRPPFERARTLLAFGSTQRRAKQKRPARESLEQALATFEELGATLWAEKARAELARIGGRPRVAGLTPSEERIAELVAEGRSNKEVAAALFLTVNTVEGALKRIYAKLGVRSRAELAARRVRPS